MTRALGPLDKRKRLSRCNACALRRIKCSGGSPCNHCIRTNKPCEPQQGRLAQGIAFVSVRPDITLAQKHAPTTHIGMPVLVQPHRDDLYFDHFASRMQNCQFTKDFKDVTLDLLPLIQSSSSLQDITLAIGALDASRRCSVQSSHSRDPPKAIAYYRYGKSIQALQRRLESKICSPDEDILWVTFFLGLFELMSQQSTEIWSMHMVAGMGKLILLLPRSATPSPVTQKLLGVHQYLEVSRAILYGTETVFSPEKLRGFPGKDDGGDIAESLRLMLQSSRFSQQFFRKIEAILPEKRCSNQQIIDLAREGRGLFQQLLQSPHQHHTDPGKSDPYEKLAIVNNCANILFLCKNFTFYNFWGLTEIPVLTAADAERLVTNILDLSNELLEKSNIPGILLLFPLRVAGAAITVPSRRNSVAGILDRVHDHGFAIASWIGKDLQGLWQWQDSMEVQNSVQ